MYEKSEQQKKPSEKSWKTDFVSAFPPARLFCGCFSGFSTLLQNIQPRLEDIFGKSAQKSPLFTFPETRLYTPSMGAGLKRIFYVFESFFPQDCLAEVKKQTCRLEKEIAAEESWPVNRPINIDPGLLTEGHIVLASTKDRGHRVPRSEGIFEEITLLFFDGDFQPLMWTYEDWKSKAYRDFFFKVRKEFLNESRRIRKIYQKAAEKKRI